MPRGPRVVLAHPPLSLKTARHGREPTTAQVQLRPCLACDLSAAGPRPRRRRNCAAAHCPGCSPRFYPSAARGTVAACAALTGAACPVQTLDGLSGASIRVDAMLPPHYTFLLLHGLAPSYRTSGPSCSIIPGPILLPVRDAPVATGNPIRTASSWAWTARTMARSVSPGPFSCVSLRALPRLCAAATRPRTGHGGRALRDLR